MQPRRRRYFPVTRLVFLTLLMVFGIVALVPAVFELIGQKLPDQLPEFNVLTGWTWSVPGTGWPVPWLLVVYGGILLLGVFAWPSFDDRPGRHRSGFISRSPHPTDESAAYIRDLRADIRQAFPADSPWQEAFPSTRERVRV